VPCLCRQSSPMCHHICAVPCPIEPPRTHSDASRRLVRRASQLPEHRTGSLEGRTGELPLSPSPRVEERLRPRSTRCPFVRWPKPGTVPRTHSRSRYPRRTHLGQSHQPPNVVRLLLWLGSSSQE